MRLTRAKTKRRKGNIGERPRLFICGLRDMPSSPYDGIFSFSTVEFRRMRQGTFSLLGRGILYIKNTRISQFGHTRYVLKLFYKVFINRCNRKFRPTLNPLNTAFRCRIKDRNGAPLPWAEKSNRSLRRQSLAPSYEW